MNLSEDEIERLTAEVASLKEQLAARESALEHMTARCAVMETALRKIGAEHDCGCSPCTGACTSKESMWITIGEMQSLANDALSSLPASVSKLLAIKRAAEQHEHENNRPGDGCSCPICVAVRGNHK